MKQIIIWILLISSFSVFANEYPDAQRDRPKIKKALSLNNITVENLKFPLNRQIFTGTMTALIKIPELVAYATGLGDQLFVTLHVIEGKFNGHKKTCIAYIRLNYDESYEVEISSCGTNFTNFFNPELLVPLTRV